MISKFWQRILRSKGFDPSTMTDDWPDQFMRSGGVDGQALAIRALGLTPELAAREYMDIGFSAAQFYDKVGMTAEEFAAESSSWADARILGDEAA